MNMRRQPKLLTQLRVLAQGDDQVSLVDQAVAVAIGPFEKPEQSSLGAVELLLLLLRARPLLLLLLMRVLLLVQLRRLPYFGMLRLFVGT